MINLLIAVMFVSTSPPPPMVSGTLSVGAVEDVRFVVLNKEDVFTNDLNNVTWSVRHVTQTNYVTTPIPMIAFDVEYSTDGSNDWSKVDSFWMPLGTNDMTGFYRAEPRIVK